MKKETQFQKDLIDEAARQGGYGIKMSNKFLAGVPDLLIKMPAWPSAVLVEMKKNAEVSKNAPRVLVGITALQMDHLRRANAAGIPSYVMSIMSLRGFPSTFFVAVCRILDQSAESGYTIPIQTYSPMPARTTKSSFMLQMLDRKVRDL